ncbi:hypothetical protein C8R45DRAFT_977346 [Mycena sanguinolenta]|nr:hypothetical protein C8R45DRAFT_977346 [Mycena sanguinolenta]
MPCLSPLASESFKTELASLSSNKRLFKRGPPSVSKQTRPPLRQIDPNAPSTRILDQQSTKAAGKRKADSRVENIPPQVLKAPNPTRELSVTNVVPSFSKHSLCSNRLGPLGRIDEEREDPDDEDHSSGSSGNISEDSNWCMVNFPHQDFSLSFCDASASTQPKKPERVQEDIDAGIAPSKISRLPKPVLKQLNRMSMNRSKSKVEVPRSGATTPLTIQKKSAGGPSTTRLPTSTQSRRNIWRT